MDQLDKTIILDLVQNCRLPYQTIAKKNGVSLNTIKKRIRAYLQDGIIEFSIEPHLANLDGDWAIAIVTTNGTEVPREFIEHLGNHDMINEVGPLSGGGYIIFAVYVGREGLSELATFLRTTDHVIKVEIHQVLIDRGKKVEFSKSELKILNCLMSRPRMRISKIADCAGYSAKTVRKGLQRIIESNGIWFTVRLRLNAGSSLVFITRIEWDERKAKLQDVITWLNTEFPVSHWIPLISVSEPIMYSVFVVDQVKEINPILSQIKSQDFVQSAISIMGTESYSFQDLRRKWLQDRILEVLS